MDRKISESSGPTSPFCVLRACIIDLASTFAPECRRKFEAQFGGYGGQAVVTSSPVPSWHRV